MRKKGVFLCLLSVLVVGVMLTGCGKKNANTKDKVVLSEVAHSIFYAPMYVAIEEGYFAEENIDLELVNAFGADKVMTAVLSGEADIGFMGPESTVYTYLGQIDDPVVNFAQLTQRAGNFLVARGEQPEFAWTDLKGKTVIGGRAGGMPEMVFEYILRKNGMDPATDLTIDQSIDFGATAAAFSGGKGDYTVEFEPSATALEFMEQDYHVVASLGVESGYVPYTCFSAKKSYLEANADLIQRFTNALQKGMNFVRSHSPEEIAKIIAPQFSETDMDTLTNIVTRYYEQDTWNTDLIFREENYELLLNILKDAGQITDEVPYGELVDTDYAVKALENIPATSSPDSEK